MLQLSVLKNKPGGKLIKERSSVGALLSAYTRHRAKRYLAVCQPTVSLTSGKCSSLFTESLLRKGCSRRTTHTLHWDDLLTRHQTVLNVSDL